jgi:uncharacterized membrane protein YfcA
VRGFQAPTLAAASVVATVVLLAAAYARHATRRTIGLLEALVVGAVLLLTAAAGRAFAAGHLPAVALLVFGAFAAAVLVRLVSFHRAIRAPSGSIRIRRGQPMPDLLLADGDGAPVHVGDLGGTGGLLMVWYRGIG